MMKQTFVAFALTALSTLVSVATVQADAPALIPIQGYLADAAGTPIDGGIKIRFRLYAADSGGTALFDETKAMVNVDAGYFTAYLGEATVMDLSVFNDHPIVYVGVLVGADTVELSPRLQLATAPYAAFAQSCGDASTVGGLTAEQLKVQGPIGPAGPKGDTGTTGGAGAKGDPGATGVLNVSATAPITASLTNQTLSLGLSALSCSAGNSIRAISATGVVTCEVDDNTVISQSTIEGYARGVCYDSEAELTGTLNDNYLSSSGGTVNGVVVATSFSYKTPVAHTLWVGVLGMEQSGAGPYVPNSSAGGATFSSASAGGYYFADDLRLPNGATITGYYCEYLDNSPTADFTEIATGLDVRTFGSKTVLAAYSSTNSSPATGASATVQTIQGAPTANAPGGSYTLNNAAASIWFGVTTNGTPTGATMVAYGCLVSYTTTHPE